jgi:hypothetical protein
MGQQQCSRHELEQFVRNSSDIDAAKLYFDSAQDASSYPLEVVVNLFSFIIKKKSFIALRNQFFIAILVAFIISFVETQ